MHKMLLRIFCLIFIIILYFTYIYKKYNVCYWEQNIFIFINYSYLLFKVF